MLDYTNCRETSQGVCWNQNDDEIKANLKDSFFMFENSIVLTIQEIIV